MFSVCLDRNDRLWFGSYSSGASCYDGQHFICYSSADGLVGDNITSIALDQQGLLWFAAGDPYDLTYKGGVSCYDGRRFSNFTTTEGLGHDNVLCLFVSRAGHVWTGSNGGGASCYDGRTFSHFTADDGLASDLVQCIAEDADGIIWFGTSKGLSRYDGAELTTLAETDGLPYDNVLSIAVGQQGGLWLGFYGGGLSYYNGREFITYTTANGLGGNQVLCIVEDQIGQMWLGAIGGGLTRYDGASFEHFSFHDQLGGLGTRVVYKDRAQQLWVGTGTGLLRREGEDFQVVEGSEGLNVRTICQDGRDHYWLGLSNWQGLARYDGERFEMYSEADGLAGNSVQHVYEDRSGRVWIATDTGVNLYEGECLHRFAAETYLYDNAVLYIIEDRRGHMWFATWDGVVCYDGQEFKWFTKADGLASNRVVCILEDQSGCLWFGTVNNGVSRYDGEHFLNFNTSDGLLNNYVTSIIQDESGHLWFGTNGGGVSRYDGHVFQTLSRKDGLVHDAVFHLLEDGDNFWIATDGGLACYRPRSISSTVEITDVIADRHYYSATEIEVPSTQEFVRIAFSGGNTITNAKDMVYSHRLRGYHEDWRIAKGQQVEYGKLPTGNYVFEVRAIDRDLLYSKPAQLLLNVAPDLRLEALTQALSVNGNPREFVGKSLSLQKVQQQLAEVGETDVTVLIKGETGTGKGLAARALHAIGKRKEGPFVHVNCGAIPEGLVESELFGHERGAFTGAVRRQLGKVELAQGGVLFLDEIGDLPLGAQVKLLHLVEDRHFERLGGRSHLQADVQIVAATNRDLDQMVAQAQFRQDLYFRLQAFPVSLPPLRQRREDIPALARYFLGRMAAHLNKTLSGLNEEALRLMQAYDWPGNVRELEHVVQRAVIICRGEVVRAEHVALELGNQVEAMTEDEPLMTLAEQERRYILKTLDFCDWVIGGKKGAAALLGLKESTLRSRMKKLGIERA